METKTVKNTSTSVPQSIVFRGTQFVIAPTKEETYDKDVADKFLEVCGPVVVDVTDAVGQTYAPDFEQQTMWVANMTGNPDAPKKIKTRRFDGDSKRTKEVEIDNPNLAPRTISREIKGGHKQYTAKDGGLVQETFEAKTIEVPPYRRRPLHNVEARWFLSRDAGSGEYAGAVIASRPPSSFEPDMTWKHDEMRVYMRLIDPSADLGLDESMLAKKIEQDKLDETAARELLRSTKQLLLRRIYYRVVDPRYRLPTRKEFNEFLTGRSAESVEKAELEALLAASQAGTKAAIKKVQLSV